MALPSIGGSFGNDTKLSNVSPTGIYASNDETDDDEIIDDIGVGFEDN